MPTVDHVEDLSHAIGRIRVKLAGAERYVALLTPDRAARLVPAPTAGSMPEAAVEPMRRLFPSTQLNITVISYTKLEAIKKSEAKCIPMLGSLVGLAYIGHSVLVFEGHPSSFETIVTGSDVLLIDSAMLPFLSPEVVRGSLASQCPLEARSCDSTASVFKLVL